MKQQRYNLAYRAAEASQVMGWIKAGQSGSVVGLQGAGKSNFLRFLLGQDVQQHYLGLANVNCSLIFVDLLSITEHTEWAFYELMLNRVLNQLPPMIEQKVFEKISSVYRESTNSRDPLLAQRAIEQCMDVLCQRAEQRTVFLFDEFDTVFRTLDPSLFRGLRAIRDAHKGQVSYIVVVTDELACLRQDLSPVEHFYRLVGRNVCGLGPYSEQNARQMICHLVSMQTTEFSEKEMAYLIELSGGHAGLLKAILSQLWDEPENGDCVEAVPRLVETQTVQVECQRIWQSLPESQQAALQALASGLHPDSSVLHSLSLKCLIRENEREHLFFSPIFADFVHRQVSFGSVFICRSPRQVRLDGREIETLGELEFELLCYLYEHRGHVCRKDDLIQNVYRCQYDRTTGDMYDAMLQTLVSRLRAKIKPPHSPHRYIITVRGEGYKFIEPN